MRRFLLGAGSLLCLLLCLAAPYFYFQQKIDENTFKTVFLATSLGWFVFASLWQAKGTRRSG